MDKAYNQTWLIYNEFSQITPLPLAWDTSTHAPGPSVDSGNLPDTTRAGALAVYNNLNGLAKNTSGYASSPIWGVVDGPFKLTFAGVSLLSPALFADLPEGKRPLAPLLRQAIAQGRVTAEYLTGPWVDVGTPERLRELDRAIVEGRV